MRSPSTAKTTGTMCGPPSRSIVARCPTRPSANRRRASLRSRSGTLFVEERRDRVPAPDRWPLRLELARLLEEGVEALVVVVRRVAGHRLELGVDAVLAIPGGGSRVGIGPEGDLGQGGVPQSGLLVEVAPYRDLLVAEHLLEALGLLGADADDDQVGLGHWLLLSLGSADHATQRIEPDASAGDH